MLHYKNEMLHVVTPFENIHVHVYMVDDRVRTAVMGAWAALCLMHLWQLLSKKGK
jgi:hypothetical protein